VTNDLSEHRYRRSPASSVTWAPGLRQAVQHHRPWTVTDLGSDGVGAVTRFSENIEFKG